MNDRLRFTPPRVTFDARLGHELARIAVTVPAVEEPNLRVERRSPFNGYVRMLTPEGGILICYQDQNRSLPVMALRVVACILVSWIGLRLFFSMGGLSALQWFMASALLILVNWAIIQFKVRASHSVEIRPEAMIIDGEDVFYAEDIGANWPELQTTGDDPDCMAICGICGTRWIEYMTVNRLDRYDYTPEVLAADLQAAMEQLWGRQEVTFMTTT